MKIEETELSNSIVVISENISGYYSAAVGVWIDVGSRDEKPELNGISHFYEHMVFKGNENRTALEIVHDIESRGGYINAFTTKENTCIYAKVIRDDLALAAEIVCDMVNSSCMDAGEFKKERQVIIEEIRSTEDSPEELVHDYFCEALWGDHSLARPIAGAVSHIKAMQQKDLLDHQKKVHTKYRIVVAASGAVDHAALVKCVEKHLCNKKRSTKNRRTPCLDPVVHSLKRKDIQQCHVVYGTQVHLKNDQEKLALILFNILFGDGMASRLFQKVREDEGLVYSVYSSIDSYEGSSGFSITFSSDEKRALRALKVIEKEIQSIKEHGVTEAEVEFAKKAVTGSLLLKVESTTSRMTRLAKQVLRGLPRESVEESVARVLSITHAQVSDVIKKIFVASQWGSAAIVPKKTTLNVKEYLNF